MSTIKLRLEGGRELQKALSELTTASARRIARKTLLEEMQPLADKFNQLAPEGDPADDDRPLKGSYAATVSRQLISKVARREHKKDGYAQVSGWVGSASPNALWQELGTVDHPPQPHVRPGWDSTAPAVLNSFLNSLQGNVDKAVARARRKAARLKG